MQDVIETLPNRPLTAERVFGLMAPPRLVGHASPTFANDEGIITFQCEHEGKIKAAAFIDSEWTQVGPVCDDLDEIIHEDDVCAQYVDDLATVVAEKRGDDFYIPQPSNQAAAPIGYQFKICVRHRPLTPEDYRLLEADSPQGHAQFEDAMPLWRNPDGRIVGVSVIEQPYDPSESPVMVFAFFNPTLDTWRIVDTVASDPTNEVMNHIHAETRVKLEEHYDSVEMIAGPDKEAF